MSTDESDTLAEHVRALEHEEHFSGIFRATRGDEVILEWCHGFANRADRVPVRPTTRFATASLSKMFTAVGVLDAVGRRELRLDDALVDVLPADKRMLERARLRPRTRCLPGRRASRSSL